MAARDPASDAGSVSAYPLQSCERSSRLLAETQGERKKSAQGVRDVILCFLLQPLTATEWWQPGVDHHYCFSLSFPLPHTQTPSRSLAQSLALCLIHSACAPSSSSTSLLHPPSLPLARHHQNIDILNVLRQLAVEINHSCKSQPRLPVALPPLCVNVYWRHKQNKKTKQHIVCNS